MLKRILDSPRLYFALAGVLLVYAVASQFEIRAPSRPAGTVEDLARISGRAGPDGDLNLLFIVIDTLRADRLGCYGYERDTSPMMDELARVGIRFANVVAQSSWTKTSMASLWTGTHPQTHGILRAEHAIPSRAVMPAEILQRQGYRTAGIYRNSWLDTQFGFNQGFDNYYTPAPIATEERLRRKNPSTGMLTGTDEDVTESARQFIETFGSEPFFLYVHYMDVHQYAYDEASALFGTAYSDAYDNAIRWVDRNVTTLLQHLDEAGLLDETLIVIVSDHGEAFLEHGLEGHAKDVHQEVVQTPFILSPPFLLEPGIVVETRVQNVDVWPTLFDMLGIEDLPPTDGVSLLPLIEAAARGEPTGPGRPAFAQLDRNWARRELDPAPMVAVTKGSHRLIRTPFREDQLYDHSRDRFESEDLADSEPGVVEDLGAEIRNYLAEGDTLFGAPESRALDEMALDHLRALGYVVEP